ncbi:MAG: hypothetical protein V4511_03055 [Bacteroidota bacterium]
MLNIKRGSLVYTLFPNQENNGFSVKLCIILDTERNCAYFVPCTTKTGQEWRYVKHFEIKKDSPEGIKMKLKEDSMVIVDRFDPLPYSIIKHQHDGLVPDSILKKIEDLLEE